MAGSLTISGNREGNFPSKSLERPGRRALYGAHRLGEDGGNHCPAHWPRAGTMLGDVGVVQQRLPVAWSSHHILSLRAPLGNYSPLHPFPSLCLIYAWHKVGAQ